jgi:hypothetical protein
MVLYLVNSPKPLDQEYMICFAKDVKHLEQIISHYIKGNTNLDLDGYAKGIESAAKSALILSYNHDIARVVLTFRG